jgi:hypothetical protein
MSYFISQRTPNCKGYIALNDRMRVKYELGNVYNESAGACLNVLFQYLSGWGGKTTKIRS